MKASTTVAPVPEHRQRKEKQTAMENTEASMVATDPGIRLLGDRVLVRRDPPAESKNGIIILASNPAHAPASDGAQFAEGTVLAVGPGKRDDDGNLIPTEVIPGQRVMFNARWNDFAHAELVGTDSDGKGPLER